MSRFYKTIKALGILVRHPWKLNLILDHNEEWKRYVGKKFNLESLPVIPFDSIVKEIEVEPFAFLDGGSMITDIALLKQLAANISHCKYFEIGTWRGESVANVAAASEVCYTLNLSENELKKYSGDPGFLASQKLFSRNLKNVNHISGNSLSFDFGSLHMKFDLIFIDGDHHYKTIVNDTQKVIQHLCHENTVIVWHDYSFNPELIRYETMAAILDACSVDSHRQIFHVENTNCAVLLNKQIASHSFKKYAVPDHYFSLKIKSIPL